ncbi:MAG TPA: nucleotidyl transferase AbiEii/AbiGii toxin family protein [Steroidobacteraceae bacterium]|nr:nucleotidyl transferase AbiEii/AbiGii toxin family protein [Steroidobacteraceae bacterium]
MSDRLDSSLLAPLVDLGKWLAAIPARGVIVGGVAASFLGRPRFTQDIDALAIIPEEDWERAIALARDYGIVPRAEDTLGFARRARVLLLKHTESAIDIDVILGGLSFEHSAVDHAETHHIGGVLVRLPRVEDLLIMKAVAHRPQDMQDIDGLLENHPEVNLEAVRRWVREFAAATAMSDLLDDFDKAVARRAVR